VAFGRALVAALLSVILALAALGPGPRGLPLASGPALAGLAGPDAALAAPERVAASRAASEARADGPDDALAPARSAALAGPLGPSWPAPRADGGAPWRAVAALARGPPGAAA
jgi:hypothetical protein